MSKNGVGQKIQIYIRLDNGNGCQLLMQKSHTLDQLATSLNNQDLQLPNFYRILFKGKYINDFTKTIEETGITRNCILYIQEIYQKKQRFAKIDVCVFWEGEMFIVKSSTNQKIINLKQSINKLLKINIKDQLLAFKGIILQNDKNLKYYKISPNSLICLRSATKDIDLEDNDSDYNELGNSFIIKNNQLLESVLSLGERKSGISKTTLFRSDSRGMRNIEQLEPYQIQIHHKNNDDCDIEEQKEFNYDLFKSFGMANPMTISIGYNLFDSLKHPVDRFTFKTFQLKGEDERVNMNEELNNVAEVESVQSFGEI